MRYVYNNSDIYEVLSPSFIELFKSFTGIKNPTKLVAQTNPITTEGQVFTHDLDSSHKEKEIIYVGRLDFVQKRVYRVIDTWKYLENRFPEWQLTIVGDGDDRNNLEKHVLKATEWYTPLLPVLHMERNGSFSLICAICAIWNTIPTSLEKCHGISC